MARGKYKRKRERAALLDQPIDNLCLSGRVEKLLEQNGLYTVRDLANKRREDLSSIPGLGPASLAEIETAIRRHGSSK